VEGTDTVATIPHAFLSQPFRNNPQSGAATVPPASPYFSSMDGRGRLFTNLDPGAECPYCGSILESESFMSGLCLFSPRKVDRTFSYGGDSGEEAVWESIVFYCPFRDASGSCEMRRYVFYASMVDPAANLLDLLDFDDNGIIESPPMTDQDWNFVLDATVEQFSLVSEAGAGGTVNKLRFYRTSGTRTFEIRVDRDTGMASVTVLGGSYDTGGAVDIRLRMRRYASGLSDFEVSTYFNNPSYQDTLGDVVNPTGVSEPGVLRITFQIDRSSYPSRDPRLNRVESVQTTMLRPRN
jgi:hypothetical protein